MTTGAFAKWYETHKEEFNAKRRARYAKDSDYRDRQLTGTRDWRKAEREKKIAEAKAELGVVTMSIGEAAHYIGRDIQSIRSWEKKSYIPRTDDGKGYRIYTPDQVNLMSQLAEFLSDEALKSPKYKASEEYRAKVAAFVQDLKERWNVGHVSKEGATA